MNAIIFNNEASSLFIPNADPRAEHIRNVLKPRDGDEVFAGIAKGPLFKAKIFKCAEGYRLSEERTPLPNPPSSNTEIYVAFARPQIAKRIIFEAACFGVKSISFYAASKGEADYAKSSLYAKEYHDHLIKGAEQACATQIPDFRLFANLQDAIASADPESMKLAPDLYEATAPFPSILERNAKFSIVFGSERGFGNPDREQLRQNGFRLTSLGMRALRTDTAIIACLGRLV